MQNKRVSRGSSLPLTWQYAADGQTIDSSDLNPIVLHSAVDCAMGTQVVGFPGSSDRRYKDSSDTWQLNWTTPEQRGCFSISIEIEGQQNGPFQFRVK
jgi:hypothetical protein